MVRLQDIADLSGVSLKTVSNVVNNYPHVSERMRERVNRAIAELGYVPDESARRLAKGRNPATGRSCLPLRLRIGVLTRPGINKYDDPFHCQVLTGIEAELLETQNILAFSQVYTAFINDPLGCNYQMVSEQLDGLITFVWHDEVRAFFRQRLGEDFPVFSVNHIPLCDSLKIDMDRAIRDEFDYLLSLGHRKIGFIGVTGNWFDAPDARYQAFRREIRTRQLPANPAWYPEGGSFLVPDSGYRLAQQLLQCPELPTALICANDTLAIGAMKALHEAKLPLPEAMSLIGFDNIPLAAMVHPALTTTNVNQIEMGRIAVRKLIERIHHPELPVRVFEVASQLQIRESTAGANEPKHS